MGNLIRVLHVDDDRALADLTATYLARENERLDVDIAGGAGEGLDRLATTDYDCVVSDYDMDGRNGVEFLTAVRETHSDVPFILFTGKGSEEVASEAISAGVTDYLQKETGTGQYAVLANRIENCVERSRAEHEREEQIRRIETLIDNLPGIVYRCENAPDWPMVDFRGEIESLTGYDPSAFGDRTDLYGSEIIHPDDRERVWETTQVRIEAGESFELSYRIRTKEGEIKHVWERGQPVEIPGEDGEFVEGVITDVTERERLLRELREEREFVPQALDALRDVFYVVGVDGRVRRWNDRLEEVSGYDASEIEGMDALEFFPADEHERVTEATIEVLESGSATVETEVETRDGSRIPYKFAGVRLTDPEGEVDGFVGIGRSVADREGGGSVG